MFSKINNYLKIKRDEKLTVNIKWNSSEERIYKIYDITNSLIKLKLKFIS